MKCPKCEGVIEPWHWEGDGGYRGIKCSTCGLKWWSSSIVRTFHEVINPMVLAGEARVITDNEFPADAETEDYRTARLTAKHAVRKSEKVK